LSNGISEPIRPSGCQPEQEEEKADGKSNVDVQLTATYATSDASVANGGHRPHHPGDDARRVDGAGDVQPKATTDADGARAGDVQPKATTDADGARAGGRQPRATTDADGARAGDVQPKATTDADGARAKCATATAATAATTATTNASSSTSTNDASDAVYL
jgi:hypothetical protein